MASSFTQNDAQLILNIARSAPIPNMDQADARHELFARYVTWINEQIAASQAAAAPASPPGRPEHQTDDPNSQIPSAAALAAAGIRPIIPQD